MHRKFKSVLVIALVLLSAYASAQNDFPKPPQGDGSEQMERPDFQKPPVMTIQQRAKLITDQMDQLLSLSEKQYDKIYKLNLKELKEMEADSLFMGRRGMGFGPGFGPGPGGSGATGNRAQFERDMARSSSQFKELSQQQLEELRAAHEKSRIKKDKQLRKILTDEQYGIWVKSEQERLVKMKQMRSGRGRRHGAPEGFRPDGEGFRPDSTNGPHHHRHHLPDSTALPQAPVQPAE